MEGNRVIVVGSVNVDLVIRAPQLPAPGETVLGGEFAVFGGGTVGGILWLEKTDTGEYARHDVLGVSGALLTVPSRTISWLIYRPATSAVNLGMAVVESANVAVLPAGLPVNDH